MTDGPSQQEDPGRRRYSYRRGQLVFHLSDWKVVEIAEVHEGTGSYELSDGRSVCEHDIEDPLSAGRRRDAARSAAWERLQRAIERGDFRAAFPNLKQRSRGTSGLLSLMAAILPAVIFLLVILAQAMG